uniref:Uncharacterized protein n=1 Tax=Anguilla anguilla TaxID=7936 RepID=A0A0E9RX89_ANGAN
MLNKGKKKIQTKMNHKSETAV